MTFLTGTVGQTWRDFADRLTLTDGQSFSVITSPSDNLAERLHSNPGADLIVFAECPNILIAQNPAAPDTTLAGWKASAATLLGLWQKNRKRTTILDWSECLADPGGIAAWCAARFGSEAGIAVGSTDAPQKPSAARVIAGLIVSRDRQAIRLWKELESASQPISKRSPEQVSPSPEAALVELSRHQENLAAEHAALKALLVTLERQHSSLSTLHSGLVAERDTLLAKLAAANKALTKTEQGLTRGLRDAFSESEVYYERWKSCEASSRDGGLLSVGAIVRGLTKDELPHRQIDFKFESVSLLGRNWRSLPVRLVEHDGNAGLVLFNPFGNANAPLYHWQPDGRENGVDYMLFVVRNKISRDRLFSCPASDLVLMRTLSAHILGHLSVHGGAPDKRWSALARRLIVEIDEIPERLHYDSVSATPARNGDRELLVLNVANLYFRGCCDRNFHFDWKPDRSGGAISIRRASDGSPLLVSGAGELGALVFGPEMSNESAPLTKLWPKLTAHDRTFLLLLAKALPDFVFHVCEQHPDQKAKKERLTKQARKLYRRLRNVDRIQKLRSAIAKIIGR